MLRLLVWVAVASASSAEKLLSLVKFVMGIHSKSLRDALTPEGLASLESSLGAEFVDALEHKEKEHICTLGESTRQSPRTSKQGGF